MSDITITEIKNDKLKTLNPIIENMDIYVPNIDFLFNRNGGIWCLCASGGSGKSSLLFSVFKTYYKKRFHNVFLFQPSSSFM
jgi:hypothetical protein